MIFLSTLLLSVFITIALIPALMRLAFRLQFVDIPDARKQHGRPIPVVGGIAMAVGAVVPIFYWQQGSPFVNAWLIGSAILVVFGMVDDFRGLGPGVKFAGQIAAALVMIFYGGVEITHLGMLLPDEMLLPAWVAVPLTLVAIVGVTNAINLADGLDGLAGGLSMLIVACIGYLAYRQGNAQIGFVALALGGAIFGFLKFNTYPAQVFMGDTGSQFLGFSAIALSLKLTQGHTALSPVLPLLLLGLPVMDTLYVFAVRLANGRSPFSADRNHFHHRLMGLGLHHSESVLVIYVLQTVLIVSAYFFRFHSDFLLLGGYLLFAAFEPGCSDPPKWSRLEHRTVRLVRPGVQENPAASAGRGDDHPLHLHDLRKGFAAPALRDLLHPDHDAAVCIVRGFGFCRCYTRYREILPEVAWADAALYPLPGDTVYRLLQ